MGWSDMRRRASFGLIPSSANSCGGQGALRARQARWTLELLADEMVRLTVHETLSADTVGRRLAEMELKPWREKMWCIPTVNALAARPTPGGGNVLVSREDLGRPRGRARAVSRGLPHSQVHCPRASAGRAGALGTEEACETRPRRRRRLARARVIRGRPSPQTVHWISRGPRSKSCAAFMS